MRRSELPAVSFLCILLLLCSLPSHIRAGSIATIALIAWLAVVSVIRGVNALVWADNVIVRLEVWCDITTKITVGFTYAIPASALCVLRHLESVASTRNVLTTQADKHRRQKFEAAMCFGLPLIGMALHYIVQGHRLDLIEDFGCYPPVYFSIAAIMILWVPPFAMSLTTFGYAAMALRHFLWRRIEFAAHLRNSQAAISPARYFRLMAMAVIEMVWDTGVNAYLIYLNSFTGLRPWTTWADVHSNFSRVAIFPESLIPPIFVTQLIWQWWIVPISCFLFFIFFGFGEEAMADYRATFIWFRRNILKHNIAHPCPFGNPPTLPTHRSQIPSSPTIDITSPTHSNDTFGHETKAWDELSLKLPEIMEHGTPTSNVGISHPITSPHRVSIFLAKNVSATHMPSALENGSTRPLDDSKRSASMDCTESSSSSSVGNSTSPSLTHTHNVYPPPVPALIATRPTSEVPFTANTELAPSRTRTPPPVFRCVPSSTTSRPTSFPGSITSVDLGIHVSPAYFPDAEPGSRYYEEAFLTRDHPISGSLPSDLDQHTSTRTVE